MKRPETIKSPNVGRIVSTLIDAGQSGKIRQVLEGLGLAECVVKDWCNELGRRKIVIAQSKRLNKRREANRVSSPRTFKRHIIREMVCPGYEIDSGKRDVPNEVIVQAREFELHATKGVRSYCIPGAGRMVVRDCQEANDHFGVLCTEAGF